MRFISTRGRAPAVGLATALHNGLAPDGGLYVPQAVPRLREETVDAFAGAPLIDIATAVLEPLIGADVPATALRPLLADALDFPIPLVPLDAREGIWLLELFHGPTLAFKDVAARTMARLLPLLDETSDEGGEPLTVLTATSGDTGGAVAQAFAGVAGTRVAVLYPRGRITPVQERQIATLGGNVRAFAVAGSFDDCQRLVKGAFADPALAGMRLTSANSINIGRLLPQIVYHFHATAQLRAAGVEAPPLIAVPSGNFGNLSAGLLARRMGLVCAGFVAATNLNDVVPAYLEEGVYRPRPSRATMSSAMDVGDPSNLARIRHLYGDDLEALRADVRGIRIDENATADIIRQVATAGGPVLDPHTAVGLGALRRARAEGKAAPGIVLATAHAAKFADVVTPLAGRPPEIPPSVAALAAKTIHSEPLPANPDALREALLGW